MKKDRIILLDALNFIYRGKIKFGGGGNYKYTVVYNFFRNLRSLIEEFEPTRCFMALEGRPQFRYDLYPQYKANRIPKIGTTTEASLKKVENEDFNLQKDIILNLISYLPITCVKAAKYEADDVLYTLSSDLKNEEVIIVSSDSDMIQIIQELYGYKITLYHPGKKNFVNTPPYHYLVWKSLSGDKSDNISGLISQKRSEKLAQDPEALIGFLKIEENRANFELNRSVIQLRKIPDHDLEFTQYSSNFSLLREEFVKMEFESIIKDPYWNRFVETFESLELSK